MPEDAWRIVGGRPLRGTVKPSGSKNGGLPTLAATMLMDGETVLHNVPRIADVETMLDLLRSFGLTVGEREDGTLRITNRGIEMHRAQFELVGRMRASHYILGPVVARLGRAEIPSPGGCAIGERPLDYILTGLEALGCESRVENSHIRVRCDHLTGGRVTLNPIYRSPGATFIILMAASLAVGTTVIENASFEPDVVTFCQFLSRAGAQIDGAGTTTLTVRGVSALNGVEHAINSDRLEAGTFLCAAASTRGEVTVESITRGELAAIADKLEEAGMALEQSGDGMTGACAGRPRGVDIVTEPFPDFPTDLQPPMAALLSTADGISSIRENIFDLRLQYADELVKMGADISLLDARTATITGVPRLHGAEIEGRNIRDGAALLVAALGAEGESIMSGRRYVARGYEDVDAKLRSLGADITDAED
jgi:UDP-N-acetylglucosamine 1-carboxyvinyltransferase